MVISLRLWCNWNSTVSFKRNRCKIRELVVGQGRPQTWTIPAAPTKNLYLSCFDLFIFKTQGEIKHHHECNPCRHEPYFIPVVASIRQSIFVVNISRKPKTNQHAYAICSQCNKSLGRAFYFFTCLEICVDLS